MDCEKFKDTLLDELYGELDEVTSAAAKRHVGGCSRCASLMSGMKATRRLAVLPVVEPPAELEERILAAAREAQKVAPLGRRASRAISWAGSWAMRPQTAMAALFLLMIGSSALLLKGKHAAPPSTMTVSEQGEPIPTATAATIEPSGQQPNEKSAPAPLASPTAAASAGDYRSDNALDGLLARGRSATTGRINAPAKPAPNDLSGVGTKALAGLGDSDDARNASNSVAGAPPQQHFAYAPGAGGGAAAPATPPPSPPAAAQLQGAAAQAPQGQSSSAFDNAKATYDAGDYATATTLFDGLASTGDLTSALWAARSVRYGSGGCPLAVARFDQVARAGAGTSAGNDATFEGGQCYRQMGKLDAAQARFRALITIPSYVDRAKTELARIGTKATKGQAKAAAAPVSGEQQAPSPPPATKAADQQSN
jgi:hypothetical protein